MLDLLFGLTGRGKSTIRLGDICFWQDEWQLGLIRNGDFETDNRHPRSGFFEFVLPLRELERRRVSFM